MASSATVPGMTDRVSQPAKEPANATPPPKAKRPPRILVVEDEPVIRFLSKNVLVHAGYHVDEAEDGDAAWRMLQRQRYDLLITDNRMPKVTGIDLIKKVRTASVDLPIIMATSA